MKGTQMTNEQEATVSASPMCSMEIETQQDQTWVQRDCTNPGTWRVFVAVNGGALSAAVYRCWEHLGGTIDFHLSESTTSSIVVERVMGS